MQTLSPRKSLRIDMSLPMVLAVVFIVLKLTHTITWPWMWVLAPLWGIVALTFVLMAVASAVLFAVGKN